MRGAPEVLVGRAHAKVNLGLAVTGVRPDGYHELASVFLRLALADTLALTVAGMARPDRLTVSDPDCPVEGNLVLRAIAELRARWATSGAGTVPGRPASPGLLVSLTKAIPMGGGLGGGSTDAACALRLAATAWGATPEPDMLEAIAPRLGADVPFFVGGHGAALVTGIGEMCSPLPALRSRVGVLLLVPSFRLATPAVFAAHDALPRTAADAAATAAASATSGVASLADAWRDGLDGAALARRAECLRDANDLWPAAVAVEPRLDATRAALEESLGRPVLMTGSGSTLVALYPSPDAAHRAASAARTARLPRDVALRVVATHDAPVPVEEPAT